MLLETKPDRKDPTEHRVRRRPSQRWHAVTIVACAGACAAVHGCKGKRYLSLDAPRLPLEQCDAARCDCKYRHYADRRAAPRRAQEKGAPEKRVTENRRESRGRRVTD